MEFKLAELFVELRGKDAGLDAAMDRVRNGATGTAGQLDLAALAGLEAGEKIDRGMKDALPSTLLLERQAGRLAHSLAGTIDQRFGQVVYLLTAGYFMQAKAAEQATNANVALAASNTKVAVTAAAANTAFVAAWSALLWPLALVAAALYGIYELYKMLSDADTERHEKAQKLLQEEIDAQEKLLELNKQLTHSTGKARQSNAYGGDQANERSDAKFEYATAADKLAKEKADVEKRLAEAEQEFLNPSWTGSAGDKERAREHLASIQQTLADIVILEAAAKADLNAKLEAIDTKYRASKRAAAEKEAAAKEKRLKDEAERELEALIASNEKDLKAEEKAHEESVKSIQKYNDDRFHEDTVRAEREIAATEKRQKEAAAEYERKVSFARGLEQAFMRERGQSRTQGITQLADQITTAGMTIKPTDEQLVDFAAKQLKEQEATNKHLEMLIGKIEATGVVIPT